MSWDIDVSEKLYQRLANEIFFRILHGKYRTGDKMPSYTELAKEAGSSPETVRKAFRELQHYGVIEKMRRGYFVTADEAVVMAYCQQYLTTIALLGSYMICREDQDDTAKSLHLIPVSKASDSVANQRRLIDDYIARHPEIEVVAEKIDDGYSGVLFVEVR